jgi:hypothetical protein
MGYSGRRKLDFFLKVAAAGLFAPFVLTSVAWAQNAAAEVPQAGVGHAASATLRTLEDMEASEAAHPAVPVVMPPNLPTVDFQQYLELKKAGPAPGQVKSEAYQAPSNPKARPILGQLRCPALGDIDPVTGNGFPPDTHGAMGANHYGQVVNSAIRFYSRALTGNCPTSIVLNQTLAGFFGYFAQGLFDPRILYDLTYNRWIVSAEAFPESAAVQRQFIAVSQDPNPTNGFFIYNFNARDWVGNGIFWDYPQIGYDEDAVILTGNKFIGQNFIGATPVFLAKHRMYAGLTVTPAVFNGGSLNFGGTLTPSNVLDQGPYTTMAGVRPGVGLIRLFKFTNTSRILPKLESSNDIAASTAVPAAAQQPGFPPCAVNLTNCLDTLDGRFQSQGTQVGTPALGSPVRLWQTRTNQEFGFPVNRAYQFNADALTIAQNCLFFMSQTSFDFNPSIVANEAGTSFVTWSATDPPVGVNASVLLGGKLFGDACGTMTNGILVSQSVNPLTGNFDSDFGLQRWGDTSAITLDPLNHTRVNGVNERVQTGLNPTTWRSFIFNAHNP